ncbi:hypothetical protein K432DRAFT_208421 [Lepidopterella palustris CBS 459.81]|uniref:Uncharacterized protein n=1 Tax=Lepidopterella palustris CBS 459.81 TaxID=1314670 RepID=A0A8E2EFG0_9PEZI|nr:hypothetical protein K432DRAFT_208421 [Lepidopterella palustris CBS 459.81]
MFHRISKKTNQIWRTGNFPCPFFIILISTHASFARAEPGPVELPTEVGGVLIPQSQIHSPRCIFSITNSKPRSMPSHLKPTPTYTK